MPGFEPIEGASIDELRALQLTRLRATLASASAVPHYRTQFKAADVVPDDVRSLDDLRKLPFTTKEDLRREYPFGMFATPMDEVVRIHVSSGTTGRPTVVGYTQGDIDTWAGLIARSLRAAGVQRSDKVHVAYGYGLFTGGLGAHYGAERLGCTVIPCGGGATERQVQLINDFQPDVVMATPSYMLVLLDEFARQGLDAAASSLRVGLFGAEPWSEAMRDEIERRGGLDALNLYGLSELMGPGVGAECIETKDGLTLWEDHFLPEIIDPETLEPLPDGQEGELVLTSLTKEAMPIIRYRTRDLTRLLPGTARPMRRIERLKGRSDDMLIIRGVNVFPSQVEEVLGRIPGLSAHYLLQVRRTEKRTDLQVLVEAAGAGLGEIERMSLQSRAEQLIKAYVGISTKTAVLDPGALERSQGKAKRVVFLDADA